ncbi:MAG: methylmalonyl Co-A mutase-associated GTPase MeaB [Chloroflexota bacterium]|nr:methylmalonyl Co-A mutase-associated GTPase MeaB [Chloroflexota bacterium]
MAGERRAMARLMSLLESDGHEAREITAHIYPHTGKAHVVGVTGPPGSGKSTLVARLAAAYRERGMAVGVVAVEPSSPFSGGAVLGDRIRMGSLSGDPGVFVRSMANRGTLGGLAQTTENVVRLLDACGYQRIIVETIGAGQGEVEIANVAHTVVVIQVPGMGDAIQTLKAGILEIADILVVNKADFEGSGRLKTRLRAMLSFVGKKEEREKKPFWQPPVIGTVATEDRSTAAVIDSIEKHASHLRESGALDRLERDHVEEEIQAILFQDFIAKRLSKVDAKHYEALIERVATRETDPYTAARELLERIKGVG